MAPVAGDDETMIAWAHAGSEAATSRAKSGSATQIFRGNGMMRTGHWLQWNFGGAISEKQVTAHILGRGVHASGHKNLLLAAGAIDQI